MTNADEFRRTYAEVPRYERRVLLAPAATAPAPLRFVNPATCPGFGDDYPVPHGNRGWRACARHDVVCEAAAPMKRLFRLRPLG